MSGSEHGKTFWSIGDAVIVWDFSEAHGDKGTVLSIQCEGLIVVELAEGIIWPVTEDELRPNQEIVGKEEI